MKKTNLRLSQYRAKWLMLALAAQLTACQTNPKLLPEIVPDNKLQNPKYASQVPDKVANVNERDAKINAWYADADRAWQQDDLVSLERIYGELEAYDPGNLRAKEGLKRVEFAKNNQALVAQAQALAEGTDAEQEQAIAKLHLVLQEQPQHPVAATLYQQLLQKQELRQRDKLVQKLGFNQPVTMEFRDVALKQVFESLSRTTKINFILDKDVPSDQKVTMFVKNMLFRDAFDLLLQTNQLDKKVLTDNSAIIYLNDLSHQRDYKDLIVRSYTLDYADAKQVSGMLKTMLGMRQIEIDTRLNTIFMKDSADVLQVAEKMIQAQDLPDPEVMLEMQVMEISRTNTVGAGVRTPTGLSVLSAGSVLTVADLEKIKSGTIGVASKDGVGLRLNETNENVNLLANPRIRVRNRDTARIHIGERVPVFTASVASTGVTSQSVQYIDVGLKLEAEPTISPVGDVSIKLSLNVDALTGQVTAESGNGQSVAPIVGTRLARTQLRLRDGETQILAGLINDEERKSISGLPGLSKLPLVGRLFGSHDDTKDKTEIVLAITPRVLREHKAQASHQSEVWVGSDGQTGRRSATPGFGTSVPFLIPKAGGSPSAAPVSGTPSLGTPSAPASNAPAKSDNINIPLPAGFGLGGSGDSFGDKP